MQSSMHEHGTTLRPEVEMRVKDPVCGMKFDASEAVATLEYEGTTYYFCAAGCKKAFEEDPERYVEGDES